MKSLLLTLALAALVPALPAAGVVLKQGDILYVWDAALVHFDPATGAREVISGCSDPHSPDCAGEPGAIVGTGPLWESTSLSGYPSASVQPDGFVIVVGLDNPTNEIVAYRVEPTGGHRTIIARTSDGNGFPLTNGSAYTVVPFFNPQLAALPAWGVPALVGLFVGVALRRLQ